MLTSAQIESVEVRLRAVEARTGTQLVAAVVERADVYHGLRWRAFALGAALAGAATVLEGTLRPAWLPAQAVLAAVTTVLGTGLAFALAATLAPPVARIFLEPRRVEREMQRRAESVFLERQLFATRARSAVLLLVCRFERQAVIFADTGFRERVGTGEWQAVAAAVNAHLRAGREAAGLLAGLAALERLLMEKGFATDAAAENELPNAPIVQQNSPAGGSCASSE